MDGQMEQGKGKRELEIKLILQVPVRSDSHKEQNQKREQQRRGFSAPYESENPTGQPEQGGQAANPPEHADCLQI